MVRAQKGADVLGPTATSASLQRRVTATRVVDAAEPSHAAAAEPPLAADAEPSLAAHFLAASSSAASAVMSATISAASSVPQVAPGTTEEMEQETLPLPSAAQPRAVLGPTSHRGAPVHPGFFALQQLDGLVTHVNSEPLWGVGLALMVLGTFASALGMLCLKRAHGPAFASMPWYKNTWFWGGIMLFAVTAAGFDVVVFAITPLALIAPFAGLTIVVSFLFATVGCCGVRETPTKTSMVAVVLITIGVTICSIVGPHDDGTLQPAQLQVTFDNHRWLFFLCIFGGFAFGIFTLVSIYVKETVQNATRTWAGALSLALCASLFGALTQLQFKALASAIMEAIRDLFDSGTTPLPMYKNAAELILQLVTVASSAVAQIGFLNYAISVAPVAYSVPAYQAGLLLATLLLSGWVLDEYLQLSFLNSLLFWAGAAIVAGGMLLNAWGLVRQAEANKKVEGSEMSEEGSTKAPLGLDASDEEAAAQARKAASAKFS